MKQSPVKLLSQILLIVGGLNWGLVGLLNFDLVAIIFGEMSLLSRVVYVAVGLAAIASLFSMGETQSQMSESME